MTKHRDTSNIAGRTRSQGNDGWGKQHVKLPDNWDGQTRRWHGYLKKKKAHDKYLAEWKKAHGQGGTRRRHRKSRSTRRR